MSLQRVLPSSILVLTLWGCRSPHSEITYRGGRLVVPPWYKLHFILHYPDGRRYEGACAWGREYDQRLREDILEALPHVRKGKKVKSVREVFGPRAYKFLPHGYGVMTLPDGKKLEGFWRFGKYVGRSVKNKLRKRS